LRAVDPAFGAPMMGKVGTALRRTTRLPLLEKYRPGAVALAPEAVFSRGRPGGRTVPRATPGSSSASPAASSTG